MQDIAKWTFQETLVLRVDNSTHHRVGETAPPESYFTNDYIVRALTFYDQSSTRPPLTAGTS